MSENDLNKHLFATFILNGKGLDPIETTIALGITPSKSFRRGDWRTDTKKWTRNFWSFTSQGEVQSGDLSIHIEWLLNRFEPVENELREIMNRKDVESEISCFWIMPTNHEELLLSDKLISRMAFLGIKLSFDIYGPD